MTTVDQVHWWLDEADRLDKLAADPPPKPDPVASALAMTTEWTEATLGPDLLRQLAHQARARAAALARKASR